MGRPTHVYASPGNYTVHRHLQWRHQFYGIDLVATVQQVNQASTGTGLQSSQNPSTVGQSVTFTATVTGSSPTGTVQFKDNGVNLERPSRSAAVSRR